MMDLSLGAICPLSEITTGKKGGHQSCRFQLFVHNTAIAIDSDNLQNQRAIQVQERNRY